MKSWQDGKGYTEIPIIGERVTIDVYRVHNASTVFEEGTRNFSDCLTLEQARFMAAYADSVSKYSSIIKKHRKEY